MKCSVSACLLQPECNTHRFLFLVKDHTNGVSKGLFSSVSVDISACAPPPRLQTAIVSDSN